MAKSHPDSKTLFLDNEFALLKQYLEADALANEYVKKNPGDLDGMRALVRSAEARRDHGLARERLQAVLQSGKAQARDYHTSAWDALFTGKIEAADVEAAVKGTQMSQHSAYKLHTLGCLHAEQDQGSERSVGAGNGSAESGAAQ